MEAIATLTAACFAEPTNTLLPLVLADALDEVGTPEATAQALALRISAEVNAKTKTAAKLRTLIRDEVGHARHTRTEIVVVEGDAAPVLSGRSWWHSTTTGVEVRHPSAYKKVAKSATLVYHPSSYLITVGAEWVAARM